MSPELAGGFLTTAPPGKPKRVFLKGCFVGVKVRSPSKESQETQCGYIIGYDGKNDEESGD